MFDSDYDTKIYFYDADLNFWEIMSNRAMGVLPNILVEDCESGSMTMQYDPGASIGFWGGAYHLRTTIFYRRQ